LLFTSGGPVFSDCIAHPSIWSSRSVKVAVPFVVVAAAPVSLSDMLMLVMSNVDLCS
jgi:hypothetical protein